MSNVVGFPNQTQPPVVDDPSAPEVFTDNLVGLAFNQGNVNMTFATVRADHSKTPASNHRKITVRLVMPIATAAVLHQLLGQTIQDLEAKGMIQRAPPPTLLQ
jgi:hypothetical protein